MRDPAVKPRLQPPKHECRRQISAPTWISSRTDIGDGGVQANVNSQLLKLLLGALTQIRRIRSEYRWSSFEQDDASLLRD